MNRQRAIEISQSPDMKDVTFENTRIYIQHVNEDETARIYPLDNPEQEMTVPLTSLVEETPESDNIDLAALNCRVDPYRGE